jgi:hypothetical protein
VTGPEDIARKIAAEAERTHSAWDGALFQRVSQTAARDLWNALGPDDRAPLAESYLTLVREAIGCGYMAGEAPETSSLVAYCLIQRLPFDLPEVSAGQRLKLLADTWNLCEGLAREPPWLDQYLQSRIAELKHIRLLGAFLAAEIEPVLQPGRAVEWKPPFSVKVIDTRPLEARFLPGEMNLVAPAVVSLRDRRRDVELAILLRHGGESSAFGPIAGGRSLGAGSGPGAAHEGGPPAKVQAGLLQVAGHEVALTFLSTPHRVVAAPAGFVVASAVDSQRVWVVECS